MNRSGSSRGRVVLRFRYACELWQQYVANSPLPQFDRWLAVAFRQYPQFGSRDRRTYREILFAAVRFGYLAVFFDFVREHHQHGVGIDERNIAALLEGFARDYGAPDAVLSALRRLPAELVLYVAGCRYAREENAEWPLTGLDAGADDALVDQLLDALSGLQSSDGDLSTRLLWQGIPLWFAVPLAARASRSNWTAGELSAFLAAQAQQPPLWLRLNHVERKGEVLQELAEHGLTAAVDGYAIQVGGGRGINSLHAYRSGAVEIQDRASQ